MSDFMANLSAQRAQTTPVGSAALCGPMPNPSIQPAFTPMNASQLVNGDNMTELISLLTNTCLNLVRLVSTSSQASVLPQSSYFIEYKSKMMKTVCEAIDRVVLNLETLLARNLARHQQMGDPVGLVQPETP